MSAPDTWTFAALIIGVTMFTLLAAGLTFAVTERLAMRREGRKGARNA